MLGSPATFMAGCVLAKAACFHDRVRDFIPDMAKMMGTALDFIEDFESRSFVIRLGRWFLAQEPGVLLDDFGPWARCVDLIDLSSDFTPEFRKYVLRVTDLFALIMDKNRDLPVANLDKLLSLLPDVISRMESPHVDRLLASYVTLIACTSQCEAAWEVILPRIPELLTDLVLPRFVFNAEFLQSADLSPVQFVIDLPPLTAGIRYAVTRLLRCHPAIMGLVYQMAYASCARFSEDGDVAAFFASILFVTSGWSDCFETDPGAVTEFMYSAAPLIDHPETVAQISLLMLIRLMCTGHGEVGEIFVQLILHAIQSPKLLVQYYATIALAGFLLQCRDSPNWEAARDLIVPFIGTIVPLTLNMAREFGIPDITAMISVIVKDPVLLPEVIGFAFELVSAMFDFATFVTSTDEEHPDAALMVVMNLVRTLSAEPDALDAICEHILRCAMETFDDVRSTDGVAGHISIFGILALHMPALPPEIWGLLDPLTEVATGDCPSVHLSVAYLFHNLMLKQPDLAGQYLDKLVRLGAIVLEMGEGRAEPMSVYFSALFRIAPPGALPSELLQSVCEFCSAIDFHEAIAGVDLVSQFTQLILSILACEPASLEIIWQTVSAWVEIADNWAVACAVALAYEFWPLDDAVAVLSELFATETVQTLPRIEQDVDLLRFEWECNAVEAVALPVFPLDLAMDVFLTFLRRITAGNPELALYLRIDDWIHCASMF
jgi:hypothetical protein